MNVYQVRMNRDKVTEFRVSKKTKPIPRASYIHLTEVDGRNITMNIMAANASNAIKIAYNYIKAIK